MTNDDLNTLKNIRTTFENALVQKDLFWMKEIASSAMISLNALITKNTKVNEPKGEIPCHVCNSNGVFNYSPIKDCICDGKAWLHEAQ